MLRLILPRVFTKNHLIKTYCMQVIKYLLVFYAFFLIAGGPLLRIVGNMYNRPLISINEYLVAVIFFVVALLLYSNKSKEPV